MGGQPARYLQHEPAGTWYVAMRKTPQLSRILLCALFGHDDQTKREPRRLALECRRCGRVTVGWRMGAAPAEPLAEPSDHRERRAAASYLTV